MFAVRRFVAAFIAGALISVGQIAGAEGPPSKFRISCEPSDPLCRTGATAAPTRDSISPAQPTRHRHTLGDHLPLWVVGVFSLAVALVFWLMFPATTRYAAAGARAGIHEGTLAWRMIRRF